VLLGKPGAHVPAVPTNTLNAMDCSSTLLAARSSRGRGDFSGSGGERCSGGGLAATLS